MALRVTKTVVALALTFGICFMAATAIQAAFLVDWATLSQGVE